MTKKKILFVCLGNICRSPAAEGIFAHLVLEKNLEHKYAWDSAGTSAHHAGEPADARMRDHASKRGINLPSRSRGFKTDDFEQFDLILTMDNYNYRNVRELGTPEQQQKVKKMVGYCYKFDDAEVPDPYYGGEAGFEHVLDMLEEGCSNLLNELENS